MKQVIIIIGFLTADIMLLYEILKTLFKIPGQKKLLNNYGRNKEQKKKNLVLKIMILTVADILFNIVIVKFLL